MHKLSDYTGNKGIEKAAAILNELIEIRKNIEDTEIKENSTPIEIYATFMKKSPERMSNIFAILNDKENEPYSCNGAEALANMLILAGDPIVLALFLSPGQTKGKKPSMSAQESGIVD